MNALGLRNLSCAAGLRTLFSGLDLDIADGQWVKLVGPNGTGKTTLLRAIAGLVRPIAGDVLWRGLPRRAANPAWHADFLYMGHASGWKDLLSARENLISQLAIDQSASRAVTSLLETVGIERQAELPFARLSAGQRKRLWLARLAAHQRPLWLLDEPTNALDAEGQALFERLLADHLQRGGCALVATHQVTDSPVEPITLNLGDYAGRKRDLAGTSA